LHAGHSDGASVALGGVGVIVTLEDDNDNDPDAVPLSVERFWLVSRRFTESGRPGGAEAGAAATTAAGTRGGGALATKICLQVGHRTCRPANSSCTWAGFWQCGHRVTKGIRATYLG
jgi:hypothetical protein